MDHWELPSIRAANDEGRKFFELTRSKKKADMPPHIYIGMTYLAKAVKSEALDKQIMTLLQMPSEWIMS